MLPRVMTSRYRYLILTLPLLLICFAILSSTHIFPSNRDSNSWIPSFKTQKDKICPDQVDWLQELDLTYPIAYARRDIIVKPRTGIKRAAITSVQEDLFPKSQVIDLTDGISTKLQHCKKPLVLEVPIAPDLPSKAPQVLFGVSTTFTDLEASIPSLQRWLSHSQARLIALIRPGQQNQDTEVDHLSQRKQTLETKFRDLNMIVEIAQPQFGENYPTDSTLPLLKYMSDKRDKDVQWISIISNETFFPSISALTSILSRYDPSEQHYIGAVSEEWWTVIHYGLMGSLRSGIFISVALADVMMDDIEYCNEGMHADATIGDFKIMRCINELSDTRLTMHRDLRPLDLNDDLSGLFESGRLPLSLHGKEGKTQHNSTVKYDYTMMHQVADICPSCFLQRWRFKNDMILSNGYSIAYYPNASLKGVRLDLMEETWDTARKTKDTTINGAEHAVGPVRAKMKLDEEKIQYRLIDSKMLDGGSVRQYYHHKGVQSDADALLELVWRRGS